jgi:CHAT domain-containing protein/Tfp pilus assembly protein PilF
MLNIPARPRLPLAGLLLLIAACLALPVAVRCESPQAQSQNAPTDISQLPPETRAQLSQLRSTLQSAITARDARTAAKTLNQIAEIWMQAGIQDNAQQAFNKALDAAKLATDAEDGVAALNGLANLARIHGQTQQALEGYTRALQVATNQGVTGGKADALNGLALLYSSQKEPAKALDYANQAIAIRRSMGDHAGEAAILAEIAVGYNASGDKQKALDCAHQAYDAYGAAGDLRGQANTLIGIGDIYGSLRDRQAEDDYKQALAIARKSNFQRIQALALNKIGLVEGAKGESQKALDNFNEALPIFQRFNMADNIGLTLSNIGMAWASLGDEHKAFDFYSQALPILRKVGDHDGEAIVLNNLGRFYQDLGEKQKAIDYYVQAAPMLIAAGDRATGVILLDNLGAAYVETNNPDKALEVLNQLISLQQGLPNRLSEGIARISMGMAYHKQGKNQEAVKSINQGLEILRHEDTVRNVAKAQLALAKVYLDMGDTANALANLNQALPLAKSMNDPLILSPILYGMMLTHKAQPSLAIFYGKQAVNLLQQVRSSMREMEQGLQSTFVASNSVIYRDLADLLVDQGRLPEAQEVLGLLKNQEYSDYIRGGATDTLSPLTLTSAEKQADGDYQKATAALVSEGDQWAQLRKNTDRTPEQEKQFQQLSDQLKQASKGLDTFYARLYELFGKNNSANNQVREVKGPVSDLKRIIAKMPHTVALYTLVGADRTSMIVIAGSADVPAVVREFKITGVELNKKVAAFQQVLREPGQDPRPLAQDLYKILIAPVKADLDQAKAETLVWSLDGVLRYVPMAALYDGKQYVVENYNTVTISPASIAHLAQPPDMSNISTVAMGISQKYEEGLPSLPAVAGELADVVKDDKVQGANGALAGTILLNGQFTRKAMENQLGAQPAVIHIASHFVYSPAGDASKSYLLLAGDDGTAFHLTVEDFRDNPNLSLSETALLTLSACETGMSSNASDGKEVDGLGMTAEYKGAKAVISSLWSVNDASTGLLMGDFYKRWAEGAGKVTKVEALRQAQLDLLLGKTKAQGNGNDRGFGGAKPQPAAPAGYSHPYYWAPFVLMGNWK